MSKSRQPRCKISKENAMKCLICQHGLTQIWCSATAKYLAWALVQGLSLMRLDSSIRLLECSPNRSYGAGHDEVLWRPMSSTSVSFLRCWKLSIQSTTFCKCNLPKYRSREEGLEPHFYHHRHLADCYALALGGNLRRRDEGSAGEPCSRTWSHGLAIY